MQTSQKAIKKSNKKADESDCVVWEGVCNHLGGMSTTYFHPISRSFRRTI